MIDRLDQLDDGRLVVIDYKSGRSDRTGSWGAERILEPQLPIYAALAFPDRAVAAVALARVTREEPAFFGVAADDPLRGEAQWPLLLSFTAPASAEDTKTLVNLYDAEIAFTDQQIGVLVDSVMRR